MTTPSIRTTVVGSYPVPSWLHVAPRAPNLRDAVMVVLKTQELAGLDVISDGELSRFDVNHPETNGMIEYFVQPLGGVVTCMSRKDTAAFHAQSSMQIRTRPAGVVRGPLGAKQLQTWLQEGITAFVSESNSQTPLLLEAARTLGKRVPEDFSLALLGYPSNPDNTLKNCTNFTIPGRKMGIQAVRMLIHMLNHPEVQGPHRMMLPCTFSPGLTVTAPSGDKGG